MNKFTCYPVGRAMDEVGLKTLDVKELLECGRNANCSALESKDPWALMDSGLTQAPAEPVPNTRVLVVDFGGTNTRALMRSVDNAGNVSWRELISMKNSEWSAPRGSKKALIDFSKFLGEQINQKLNEPAAWFDGVSVVWSNGASARPLDGENGFIGVGAAVTGKKSTYVKGEPFVADLNDGDRIDDLLLIGLGAEVFFDKLVISNDTVFTQMDACSGVICSTGTNTTLNIRQSDGSFRIFNSESGHRFKISPEFLSIAEARQYPGGIPVERLTAGGDGCIPELFSLNLKEILEGPAGDIRTHSRLKGLSTDKNSLKLSASQISKLANSRSNDEFPQDVLTDQGLRDSEKSLMRKLASTLHERGGKALASLIYFSVANQVSALSSENPTVITVNLDSAVARHSEVFLKALMDGIGELNSTIVPHSIKVSPVQPLKLRDKTSVSVPAIGAANVIDRYL